MHKYIYVFFSSEICKYIYAFSRVSKTYVKYIFPLHWQYRSLRHIYDIHIRRRLFMNVLNVFVRSYISSV